MLAVPHYPDFLPFADSSVCASLTALDVFCCLCENPSVCYSLLAVGPNVPSAPVRRISSQHLEIQMFIFLFINDPQWETESAELQKTSPTIDRSHSSSCQMPSVFQGQICCKLSWHVATVMLSGQLLHTWLIIYGRTFLASLEIKSEMAEEGSRHLTDTRWEVYCCLMTSYERNIFILSLKVIILHYFFYTINK